MWIWYGYLQRVIIPFLKSCHEIWVDFLNYPLDFCPVGGYREDESNSEYSDSESDSDSNSESDNDSGSTNLTTVLEKGKNKAEADEAEADEAEADEAEADEAEADEAEADEAVVVCRRDTPEYSSISQFLITGILNKCMTSVSNKSFLDEWIIVDKKHIEKKHIDDKKNE